MTPIKQKPPFYVWQTDPTHITTLKVQVWSGKSSELVNRCLELQRQRDELLAACKAMVNIATHPKATLAQVRLIVSDAKAAIARTEGRAG